MTSDEPSPETNKAYAIGLARAFGGAVIFAIPLLMTMEMWSLGFTMGQGRLLLFLATNFAILIGLSYFAGFEKTFSWKDDALDAFAAFGVGLITSSAMLALFGVVSFDTPWHEIVGKVALQSVPASLGAMLGRKQLGAEQDTSAEDERKREAGYGGELFLMLAGALFLAFNVAPTEEMILIAIQMTPWHALALGAASIVLLHVFVYTVGFSGQEDRPEGGTFLSTFLQFTLAGYGLALLVSLYVLWTFGRTDAVDLAQIAMMAVVLAFPAALGLRLPGWWFEAAMDRSKANPDERRARPKAQTPWLEWVASGVGLLLALIVFGLIGWQAMNDASEPPTIIVEVDNVTSVPGGFRVEFRARNTGGSAGAQIEIEGILLGDEADETSRVVFDYVPGHSVRQGGLFFTRDPRSGHLSLRARGYSAP